MKRICAWCGADLDGGEPSVWRGEPISHGICGSCRSALHAGGWTLRKFLEKLPEPVLLVTQDVVVEAANAAACTAVGKRSADMEGCLGGAILECAYARLPGGCGKTMHCTACQIRASVAHTFRTGEPLLRVEAYQDVLTLHCLRRRRLSISTEKVNERVLLRVDSMETLPQQGGDRPGA